MQLKYTKSVYPSKTFKVNFVCFNSDTTMLEFSQLLFHEAHNYYPSSLIRTCWEKKNKRKRSKGIEIVVCNADRYSRRVSFLVTGRASKVRLGKRVEERFADRSVYSFLPVLSTPSFSLLNPLRFTLYVVIDRVLRRLGSIFLFFFFFYPNSVLVTFISYFCLTCFTVIKVDF